MCSRIYFSVMNYRIFKDKAKDFHWKRSRSLPSVWLLCLKGGRYVLILTFQL